MLEGWGERIEAEPLPADVDQMRLDSGEAAVLASAFIRPGATVILDDAVARRRAREIELPVVGTLGIVLRAKNIGALDSATAALRAIKEAGLYLDDELIAQALATVGEEWP